VASDYKKPDGLFVIKPEDALSFIDSLAIEKFFGVGKVTASSMHELGISNGKELREKSRLELEKHFGKFGSFYFDLSRGIDNRKVNPDHIRKSIGAENTFEKNIEEPEELLARLMPVADEIFRRMEKSRTYGSTITLKIKYSDFSRKTKSITVGKKITDLDYLKKLAQNLLENADIHGKSIRLLGLSVSNLGIPKRRYPEQLELFEK
jgi:DNA polymerase-4